MKTLEKIFPTYLSKSLNLIGWFILVCISFQCKTVEKKGLHPLQFYAVLPIIDNTGHLDTTFTRSVDIVRYNNIVLLNIAYRPMTFETISETAEEVVNRLVFLDDTAYEYFIYKKGEPKGYEYYSLDSPAQREQFVDTFYNNTLFATMVFYDPKTDSLVSSQRIDKNRLEEKYIPKIKYDASYPDTTVFLFDKRLQGVDYTLSKKLDSLRKMKLVKVVSIFNHHFNFQGKDSLVREEMVFGIRPSTIKNEKEVINFMKKFEEQR